MELWEEAMTLRGSVDIDREAMALLISNKIYKDTFVVYVMIKAYGSEIFNGLYSPYELSVMCKIPVQHIKRHLDLLNTVGLLSCTTEESMYSFHADLKKFLAAESRKP